MELTVAENTLDSVFQFARDIASAGLEYPHIITIVAQSLAGYCGDICVVSIRTPDGNWFEPVASGSSSERAEETIGIISTHLAALNTIEMLNDSLSGLKQAYSIPTPASKPDKVLDTIKFLIPLPEKLSSPLLVVPLRVQANVFGVILIARSSSRAEFTQPEAQIIQDLADISALAIENARLYAIEAQRARELNALHNATSALLTSLDKDVLLGQILDHAMNAIPSAEMGDLHLIAKETGKLELRAALGYIDPRIKKIRGTKIHSYTAKAIQSRQSVLISNAAQISSDRISEPEQQAINSIIIAPLILGDEVLGALTLSSKKKAAFTDSDKNLLVSFATTTTAALHNAQLHGEVQKLAITDALTNLYNRRGFFEIGRREIERARRFKHPLSIILMDIDHFKQVNDAFGHAVGDRVLISLATTLINHTRSIDIVGRYGGDEFVILLPETDLFTANAVSERLLQYASKLSIPTEKGLATLTISIGISKAVADTQDLASLIESADTALYFAKQRGRNRIEIA
jgi:diguanylate cyclase (GGDEF)-like protein